MPRGHKQHCMFDQFDIAAILNLMSFCKHFKNIKNLGQCVSKVSILKFAFKHHSEPLSISVLNFSNAMCY